MYGPSTCIRLKEKPVAQVWERETSRSLMRFRLTSSIICKITKLHFWPSYGPLGAIQSALYESLNAKKNFVAEFYRENACFTRKTAI